MSAEREGLRAAFIRTIHEWETGGRVKDGSGAAGGECTVCARRAESLLALLDSEPEPWRGASEPCEACGAPAGVACPEPSDECRAICSCPTCGEITPDEARGIYDRGFRDGVLAERDRHKTPRIRRTPTESREGEER